MADQDKLADELTAEDRQILADNQAEAGEHPDRGPTNRAAGGRR